MRYFHQSFQSVSEIRTFEDRYPNEKQATYLTNVFSWLFEFDDTSDLVARNEIHAALLGYGLRLKTSRDLTPAEQQTVLDFLDWYRMSSSEGLATRRCKAHLVVNLNAGRTHVFLRR